MEQNKIYEYSTHIPMLRAVMRDYKPLFVLELGIGLYSTPILCKSSYLGIENNFDWILEIIGLYPEATVMHHRTDIGVSTLLKDLNEEQKSKISEYYKSLIIPGIHPNFLFVDNYASFRTIAINELRDKFDLIAYHDCQPDGVRAYAYDNLNKEGFNSYYLKSPTSWTCLMVRPDIDKGMIDLPIDDYLIDWPDCKSMSYE